MPVVRDVDMHLYAKYDKNIPLWFKSYEHFLHWYWKDAQRSEVSDGLCRLQMYVVYPTRLTP